MKRPLFTGILIFSLALNVAVAVTVGWHLWQQRAVAAVPTATGPTLTQQDVQQISEMMPQQRRQWMMQARQQVLDKKSQVLDQIARNPGDLKAVEPTIQELLELKNTMERQALVRISLIMGSLPEEKRAGFLEFLKTRACGGGGMGWGRGRGRGCGPGRWGACPVGNQSPSQAKP
jgi:hypothetical protein